MRLFVYENRTCCAVFSPTCSLATTYQLGLGTVHDQRPERRVIVQDVHDAARTDPTGLIALTTHVMLVALKQVPAHDLHDLTAAGTVAPFPLARGLGTPALVQWTRHEDLDGEQTFGNSLAHVNLASRKLD